jgi:hypothetical protein
LSSTLWCMLIGRFHFVAKGKTLAFSVSLDCVWSWESKEEKMGMNRNGGFRNGKGKSIQNESNGRVGRKSRR